MNFALQNLETRFLNSNPAAQLPPTWQVIYQEAIRGNHILFSPEDLRKFDVISVRSIDQLDSEEALKIEEAAFRVMTASNYEEMSETIAGADFEIRLQIFQVYKRLISVWSSYLKTNLH